MPDMWLPILLFGGGEWQMTCYKVSMYVHVEAETEEEALKLGIPIIRKPQNGVYGVEAEKA